MSATSWSQADVRPAAWRDLLPIWRLHRVCFPHAYSLWRFVGYHIFSSSWIFVATRDEELLGYVVATTSHYRNPPRAVGEIISLAVAPRVRARGLGRALLERGARAVAEAGLEQLYLQVAVSNTRAQKLYQQFGFACEQRLDAYYADGEDAFLMVTRLALADES